jgi:hypothetical protein
LGFHWGPLHGLCKNLEKKNDKVTAEKLRRSFSAQQHISLEKIVNKI